MNIQIVEDDRALSEGIAMALDGPELSFVSCMNIRQAREVFERTAVNLIILDVNLPDGSGYDYLKWVRERAQTPVLILTANDMEMDEVMGLNLGADDYMSKPFSLAVLRARIQALLRRSQKRQTEVYTEDGFSFDFARLIFRKNGREILLSTAEQKLLRLFTGNRGKLLTRSFLVDYLWSDGGDYVDENALSVAVNRLRGKLEDRREAATYIQTVYGQGYMWKRQEREKSCTAKNK